MGVPATVRVRISASHTLVEPEPIAVIALDGELGIILPSDLGAFGGECKKGGGGVQGRIIGPAPPENLRRYDALCV